MESEVVLIADELSRAVELTLNPTVAHEARNQAYTACESFKENSPWCAQAGLLLATGAQYSAVVKHFGLQLMEHTVKYRWTQITQAEKLFIKENAMKLLYLGGWETGHLNDALARVIVEMIKREWPQQWPTLLSELSDACTRGHVHTQIVLHIFLRLVEDVATLQTLEQNQRRKDIYQALTSNMAEIFAFFMRLTELHVQVFREKTAAGDYAAANSNGRVVQVVLLTLTGFVEWVSTTHIVANDGRLLQMLCILLQDSVFQVSAAECLLQVVNRKGPTKERKPLLIMLSEDAITCIHRAALATINSVDENSYLFLKKLSQVLAGLAQQLTSLWGHITNSDSWMGVYLETVLLLMSHPSLSVAHMANAAWLAMLKHEQISKQPHVVASVPAWLQAAAPKVLKVTYGATQPGINDAVAYASIDYDCEQEFTVFFNRCRTEILDSFRYSMSAAPLVTWAFVEQWTESALDKVDSCGADITIQHPVHIEWEALSQVLDVVLSRLLTCSPRPPVPGGLRLLQRCVSTAPRSPLLLSLLLSFLSALFVFLSCCSQQLQGPTVAIAGAELLPQVLDKIFTALVYESTPTEDKNSRYVKNVRLHAGGLLVKLASKYPLLLLPQFGRLHEATRAALCRLPPAAAESVAAQEALLLLSNQLACFPSQQALVGQVLGDCAARWAELTPHLSSAASLVRLLGLDTDSEAGGERAGAGRRALLHCLALLLAVVRRCVVPPDPDKATRGGYSAGTSPSGNPLWRNPCSAHVLPMLPGVLSLLRALHALCGAPALLHREPARCLAPPAAETRALLGRADDPPAPAPPAARLQQALHTMHDHACHLIGAASSSLGREFYTWPDLGPQLATALAAPAASLPAHWLRRVLRAALKPLAAHTAPPHARALLPVIDALAPNLLSYLTQRWEYITMLHESGKLEDEAGSESQEVLEDMLIRNLTREYLDFLKIALLDVGPITETSNCDMEEDNTNVSPQRMPEQVSEIGGYILSQPAATPILHTILRALTWLDATSSLRACALVVPVLRCMAGARRVAAGEARGALAAVLQALRAHGQHDANQAACLLAALQTYEILRPMYPDIVSVLHSIPDVDAHDLNRLDEKLAANSNKPSKIDKSKRDLFKKITSRLIGRNVGQLFKKEVYILDLPTMHVAKEKPRSTIDAPEGANLEGLFANRAPT